MSGLPFVAGCNYTKSCRRAVCVSQLSQHGTSSIYPRWGGQTRPPSPSAVGIVAKLYNIQLDEEYECDRFLDLMVSWMEFAVYKVVGKGRSEWVYGARWLDR